MYTKILQSIDKHNQYRRECINLIASENVMSPMTRKVLASDLGNRYSYGEAGKKLFAGNTYMDQIECIAVDLAKKAFSAEYVTVQPISGMVANLVAFNAVLKPNDIVMTLPLHHGSHFSHEKKGMLKLFQARIEYLPFNSDEYVIDINAAKDAITKLRPKLIIVGAMEFLFPVPLRELKEVCSKTGTYIMYDAAHVAGLIAGGTFQNPLQEGADILSMSTNKTLAGPDHGIVATSHASRFREAIWHGVNPMFLSNIHPHHIGGLAITLAELQMFGRDYATQVIKNAQALAKELYKHEIDVLCPQKGFTQSHTLLINTHDEAMKYVRLLEQANIMSNTFMNCTDTIYESGLRFGTNEITRVGMKEQEMKIIAQFICNVLLKRRSVTKVRDEVREFRKPFQKVHYCFE